MKSIITILSRITAKLDTNSMLYSFIVNSIACILMWLFMCYRSHVSMNLFSVAFYIILFLEFLLIFRLKGFESFCNRVLKCSLGMLLSFVLTLVISLIHINLVDTVHSVISKAGGIVYVYFSIIASDITLFGMPCFFGLVAYFVGKLSKKYLK